MIKSPRCCWTNLDKTIFFAFANLDSFPILINVECPMVEFYLFNEISKFLVAKIPGKKLEVFSTFKRYFECRKYERFSFHFANGHQHLAKLIRVHSYENKRVPLAVSLFNEPNGPEKTLFIVLQSSASDLVELSAIMNDKHKKNQKICRILSFHKF